MEDIQVEEVNVMNSEAREGMVRSERENIGLSKMSLIR